MKRGLLNRVFRIVDFIKNIRKRNEQKKYNYVFNLGYRYFYDIQEYKPIENEVNIPDFLNDAKRKEIAYYFTAMQMKKIMEANSLNHCYKSAKRFAKSHKQLAMGL